jgi:diguanylate cyclase (GGDEF)-like protein
VRSAADSVLARAGSAATFELRAEHADGRWIWLEAHATNLLDETDVSGLVVTVRDISERKTSEADLRHRALHDILTGLPNRTLLVDRLSGAIYRSGRDGRSVTVFFLDLDAFKEVNDSFGHSAGDEVLAGVAGRLASVARTQDTVARYGGDEFVVVVEHEQDPEWVLAFAERLRSVFEKPMRVDRRLVAVTASFGIATATGITPSPESLLRDADAAMYRAKNQGGNAYVVFDDSMVDSNVVDLTQ